MASDVITPWEGDIEGLCKFIFYAILWLITLAVTSKYVAGPGTKNWSNLFITAILVSAIVVQYYYLMFAVMYFPPSWAAEMLMSVQRLDCLESNKGGKVGMYDEETILTRNPCYCRVENNQEGQEDNLYKCYDADGNQLEGISWEMCPVDGSCYKGTSKIDPFISSRDLKKRYERDCDDGRGAACNKLEPCTPCQADLRAAFGTEYCTLCSTLNDGDCGFVEGVGPYCWASPDSREIVPCTECCSSYTGC